MKTTTTDSGNTEIKRMSTYKLKEFLKPTWFKFFVLLFAVGVFIYTTGKNVGWF